MTIVHTGIRAYAFQCTYNEVSWLDDPTTLISEIQYAIHNHATNITSYEQIKVANVRNSTVKQIEIEIVNIIYKTKNKLTATENDDLIFDLESALDTITNLIYDHINIVNDIFRDSPSSGWPGQSFQKE